MVGPEVSLRIFIFGLFPIISLKTRAENAKLGDAIKSKPSGVERWFSPF